MMALTNGEFGRPFVPHPQHDNILTAYGWTPWWSDKRWPEQDQDPKRPLKVGEYRPIDGRVYPYRVIEGDTCQAWFVQFGLMNGGIYQQVQVGAGKRVTFDLPFQTW